MIDKLPARDIAILAEKLERYSCPEALTGCTLWTGCRNNMGYGAVRVDHGGKGKVHIYAHRFAWMLLNGPIPDGLIVRHRCDTPACVNPEHLELGTMKDNSQDMVKRGRNVPGRKISPETVLAIRAAWGSLSQSKIAAKYGISQPQVNAIVHRRQWKGLP